MNHYRERMKQTVPLYVPNTAIAIACSSLGWFVMGLVAYGLHKLLQ
jgi:hypothetical protein